MKRLVIAAGGTGGHMFPAQSLAEAMLARGWRVTLSTDERGARYAGGFPVAVTREVLPSATFARGGLAAKAAVPFRIGAGVLSAVSAMRKDRPDVVVGFGGYPSIPALTAATLLRLPRMIHEQNGVLGKVNTAFATRVDVLACGTWPTELPDAVNATFTGNPVRAAVSVMAAEPYVPPAAKGPLRLLMIGGSQGARILSDVVPAALAALPEDLLNRIEIAHQARPEDTERVTAAYAEAGIPAEVRNFFHDIPERFAAAQLVIARAGASTLADLTVVGRPAILVPYAAAMADHQTANAAALVKAGGARAIAERDLTPDRMRDEIVSILQHPGTAAQMAHSALGAAAPDAVGRLVSFVERLADPQKRQTVRTSA